MTRKQHYIPRFYLERFTDSSRKLWIYDASRDIVFEKSPEGACVRTDLYETEWIEANEKLGKYVLPNDIEDLYSRYEAEFSAFLRELDHILIRDQLLNASICSAKNRRLMFRFIANLLFRNPKTMEEYKLSEVDTGILGEDGTNELCEILDKMGIGGGRSILKAVKKKEVLTEEYDGGEISEFIKSMEKLPFIFLYAMSGNFVLCDPPVTTGYDVNIDGDNRDCIFCPLSPKTVVLFGNYQGFKKNKMYKIEKDIVDRFNYIYIGKRDKTAKMIICNNEIQRAEIMEKLRRRD